MENNEENEIRFPVKPFKVFVLVLGIPLTLLGLSGIIIDLFFPFYTKSFHSWAGTATWQRLLLGAWLLLAFFFVNRKVRNQR